MKLMPAVTIGAVLGTILAMLAVCVVDLHRQFSLAQTRISMLESSCESGNAEMVTLRNQLDELQSWRVQVTLASRMGWPQAVRFIREFPLEALEAE